MVLLPLIFCLSFIAFFIITTWKLFEKAGEQGWASIIPIYNVVVFLKIVGKPWWWVLLMCIPGINYIFIIWAYNMCSKSFGKDSGYTAGLFFLSFIFFPVLAFGDAKYMGPFGDPVAFEAYRQKRQPFDFENNQFEN